MHDLGGRRLISSSVAQLATNHAQAIGAGFRINHRASGAARAVSLNPPTPDKAATVAMAIGGGGGPVPRHIRGGTLATAGLLQAEKTCERFCRISLPPAEEGPTEIPRADRCGTRDRR